MNRTGRIKISTLEEILDDDVLSVSIMAINNEIGTIQGIETISECIRRHGAVFHCDTAQASGVARRLEGKGEEVAFRAVASTILVMLPFPSDLKVLKEAQVTPEISIHICWCPIWLKDSLARA